MGCAKITLKKVTKRKLGGLFFEAHQLDWLKARMVIIEAKSAKVDRIILLAKKKILKKEEAAQEFL